MAFVEFPGHTGLITEVTIADLPDTRHQHARIRLGTSYPHLARGVVGRLDHGTIRGIVEWALKAQGYVIVEPPDGASIDWWCPIKRISGHSAYLDWSVEAPVEKVYA